MFDLRAADRRKGGASGGTQSRSVSLPVTVAPVLTEGEARLAAHTAHNFAHISCHSVAWKASRDQLHTLHVEKYLQAARAQGAAALGPTTMIGPRAAAPYALR